MAYYLFNPLLKTLLSTFLITESSIDRAHETKIINDDS